MTAQAPVELLCLTQRAPLLLHGTIAQPESNCWVFTSDEPVELSVIDCNAIVNTNHNEYNKYIEMRNKKLSEVRRVEDIESEVKEIKNDLNEIKSLLLDLARKQD